jgi:hypothetical protein
VMTNLGTLNQPFTFALSSTGTTVMGSSNTQIGLVTASGNVTGPQSCTITSLSIGGSMQSGLAGTCMLMSNNTQLNLNIPGLSIPVMLGNFMATVQSIMGTLTCNPNP